MSHPETRLLTATAIAVLAIAGWDARAADPRSVEQVAFGAPSSFAPLVTTGKPVTVVARKKPKPEKKAKILTGLQSFRMPAQRALDRLNRPASPCQPVGIVCPAVFHDGPAKSQPWQYATVPSSAESESEQSIADMSASGEPALVRPFTDVPGFVPGRETIYRFSLDVPMGRDEHVQLQAKLRRNAYNTVDSSDSTLRADWSLRF